MDNSLAIYEDNNEVIEFNGYLDDLSKTVCSIYKNEISIEEAKFIVGVLVEKRNLDNNVSLTKLQSETLDSWVDSKATDAGIDTRFGYIVLQTSKIKVDAIHLVYDFFLNYLAFSASDSDPVNYLGVFSIGLIWYLVTAIKVIKEENDKIVMATIIEKDVGGKEQRFTIEDIQRGMEARKNDNIPVLDEDTISKSLENLAYNGLIRPLGCYWTLKK